MKKIIILFFIISLSLTLTGCSNNKKKNTMTCKWSRNLNTTKYQDLNIEFIFNFNSNDELVSVNENQFFDNSNILIEIPSDTKHMKEEIEEIKYVKVDININKSNKDMFYNYTIDVDSIKNDLYNEIITTDFYNDIYERYPRFPIITLSDEFLKEYIHYNKETLKVKLITDLNFNCK